jgi:hypothetical protein
MKDNMSGGKSKGRSNYPCTPAELDAANKRAHIPHTIPDQSEKGRDRLVSAHRKVTDEGMISRPDPLPGAQSSPAGKDIDIPYASQKPIR